MQWPFLHFRYCLTLSSQPPLGWGSGKDHFRDVETEAQQVKDLLQVTLAGRGAGPEASRGGGGEFVWIQILALTSWPEEDH